jgi:hypothetical protein
MSADWAKGFPDHPFVYGSCPICGWDYYIYLRRVGGKRTQKEIPLFYCMECQSFTCLSDYVETDEQRKLDTEFFIEQRGAPSEEFAELVKYLSPKVRKNLAHADIGCALGNVVDAFRKAGFKSTGYDINPFIIEAGRRIFPEARLLAQEFGSDNEKYNLVTLIDTLEHIRCPFSFMSEMVDYITRGGFLYISVPRLNKLNWPALKEPIADQFTTSTWPFIDNDVHGLHFSDTGLRKLGERCGLWFVEDNTTPWPLNGMLFKKP